MVMLDAQTVRGGRAGPTFHAAGGRGGRTFGAKRSILVEILGLPLAVRVDPARPHDVVAGRELLADRLPELPRVRAVVADRAYRGLARLAARRQLALDIKVPPPGTSGFVPLRPLYRVEHAFAQLGRWRRLSRCYQGTAASARAWLEVAAHGLPVRAFAGRACLTRTGGRRLRARFGCAGHPATRHVAANRVPAADLRVSHPRRPANVSPTPSAILSRVQVGVGRRDRIRLQALSSVRGPPSIHR